MSVWWHWWQTLDIGPLVRESCPCELCRLCGRSGQGGVSSGRARPLPSLPGWRALHPAGTPSPFLQSALAAFGVARATDTDNLTVANVFSSLALLVRVWGPGLQWKVS